MMQLTEEQRKALLEEIEYNRKNCFLSDKTELLMQIAEAALTAKPVAYRWEVAKTGRIGYDGIKPIGVESQPLYATPPVAAPAVHDGYVIVPRALTAENGAKAALLGEFNLEYNLECHECFGEGCDDCSGEGRWINSIPVDWTTIKEIWAKGVEHFQATAPAINLAELVPDEIGVSLDAPVSIEWVYRQAGRREGWNACRAEMLRKIEEAR